jgi:hypothetical protein
MAKSLVDELRSSGLRKRIARELDKTTKRARSGRKDARKSLQSTVGELRSVLDQLEDRAKGGPDKRKAAAKKAAATRKRKAARRSAAAKKGARTRAKS